MLIELLHSRFPAPVAERHMRKTQYKEIFKKISESLDGAYCLAFLDAAGKLIVVRDPQGFKPLSYVITDDCVSVASESVAGESIIYMPPRELKENTWVKIKRFKEK